MGSHGIKDRVAIVGMGCTRFAEHWDKSLDDLIIEASQDTFAAAFLLAVVDEAKSVPEALPFAQAAAAVACTYTGGASPLLTAARVKELLK